MHDDRWQEIIQKVKDSFPVEEHDTKPIDDRPGTVEYIIFTGPLGKMKLARTTSPKVMGTRGMGSHRIGGETSVQYQYSDSEFVHTFTASVWKNNDWHELDPSAFTL
ncbi:MAG: hypothetical protein HZC01_00400 [Candidatus Kerfeldbacteria bacterium]|nr:hypothetical protein [Candidatus Kerfeldbacteria bacterium]